MACLAGKRPGDGIQQLIVSGVDPLKFPTGNVNHLLPLVPENHPLKIPRRDGLTNRVGKLLLGEGFHGEVVFPNQVERRFF